MADGLLENPFEKHKQTIYQYQTHGFEIIPPYFIPFGTNFINISNDIKVIPEELIYNFHEKTVIQSMINNYNEFSKSLFFSIFYSALLLEIGLLTTKFDNNMRIILDGGINLKYFIPSYYTKDIDIKVYPKNYNSSSDFKQIFIDEMSRVLERMIDIAPVLVSKYLKFIDSILNKYEHPENIKTEITKLKENFESDKVFNFQFSIPPHRIGVDDHMYKLILIYKDLIYPLIDVTFYDKKNKKNKLIHYNTLNYMNFNNMPITNYISKDKITFEPITNPVFNDIENITPPTVKVKMKLKNKDTDIDYNFHYYLLPFDYIFSEKIILYHDITHKNLFNPDANTNFLKKQFLTNKFLKSFQYLSLYDELNKNNIFLQKYLKYKKKYLNLKSNI